MKKPIPILVALIICATAFSQDRRIEQQTRKRLKIAEIFFAALRDDSLTNEQILKDLVVESDNLKNDSIFKIACEILDGKRQTYKDIDAASIEFLKYADHPEMFEVIGVRPLNDVSNAKIKREFSAQKYRSEKVRIGIDDIYVIKAVAYSKVDAPEGVRMIPYNASSFLLFDENDKIASFFPWTIGEHTSFLIF